MTVRNPMARFGLALPLAGTLAAVLSVLVLGMLAIMGGLPPWMPLNATSHVLHGPAVATIADMDLTHTAPGTIIHIVSAFFWAGVAILLLRVIGSPRMGAAWVAGLGTAALAGVVDYGLLPARLSPGWELVLPPSGVVAGLLALGIGIASGLTVVRLRHADILPLPPPRAGMPGNPPPPTDLERLRRPAPTELDQRQQRIDPANMVTEDPNRHGDLNTKQPGGSGPGKNRID